MEDKISFRNGAVACVLMGALLLAAGARADLKPGDVLDQAHWQEARGLMPGAVLRRFETGQHISKVIEIPQEALHWSTKFKATTEANQGTYKINEKGILIEKATGTWPCFGYGLSFAHIDPSDPKAPYQIMYNFFRTLGQADDINVCINFFWTTPTDLDRYIDFRSQAPGCGSQWSGPIPNPDEAVAKVLIYRVAPYNQELFFGY